MVPYKHLWVLVVILCCDLLSQAKALAIRVKRFDNTGPVSCVNLNFINKLDKPFRLWKTVSEQEFKGFIVKGKSLELKTLVSKRMRGKPVKYSAVPLDDSSRAQLLLNGEDSLAVLPFDCADNFVNVEVTYKSGCLETVGGNSKGKCCSFPFIYKDTLYNHCTMKDSPALWCATRLSYDTHKEWGFCK
ncbi:secretory phospholipase A2 receptor isoform X2 [Nematostella vectensis]|uniref:secretory phospholipase A2 receptor isoform X2 n=1 Tax=Nematostella vectensis TaxID=45351 RepID=UPI0020779310|nr:secretory phospholipase A2 receptor isoform X2 [Nematostella vectensis]